MEEIALIKDQFETEADIIQLFISHHKLLDDVISCWNQFSISGSSMIICLHLDLLNLDNYNTRLVQNTTEQHIIIHLVMIHLHFTGEGFNIMYAISIVQDYLDLTTKSLLLQKYITVLKLCKNCDTYAKFAYLLWNLLVWRMTVRVKMVPRMMMMKLDHCHCSWWLQN